MSEMPVVMPDMAAVAQLFVDYNTFFHVYPRYVGLYGLFTEVTTRASVCFAQPSSDDVYRTDTGSV